VRRAPASAPRAPAGAAAAGDVGGAAAARAASAPAVVFAHAQEVPLAPILAARAPRVVVAAPQEPSAEVEEDDDDDGGGGLMVSLRGRTTVPAAVFAQLDARAEAYPVPWDVQDEDAAWLRPARLLLYLHLNCSR